MKPFPGAEVRIRGVRWQVVFTQELGPQTLYRLRGIEGALRGHEIDFLHPLEPIEPIVHGFQSQQAGPLRNWLVFHQAFLLEQTLGCEALLTVQRGWLHLEPYQLVPVWRALRMRRPRLWLADSARLGSAPSPTYWTACCGRPSRAGRMPDSASTTPLWTWKTWAASTRRCWNCSLASAPNPCVVSGAAG